MSQINIYPYDSTLSYNGKEFKIDCTNKFKDPSNPGRVTYSMIDEVDRVTDFKVISSRDGGFDGNRIFKVLNKNTNEIYEVRGYWSTSGVVTIYLDSSVQ